MGIRESLLNTITSVGSSDFVRIVTSAGASSKATLQNVIKSFETGLSAKSSLADSDYIRIVGSDNNLYKQSMQSVIDTINAKNATENWIADCNNATDPTKVYTTNASTANRPPIAAGYWYIRVGGASGQMLWQIAETMNATVPVTYVRKRNANGEWGTWTQEPTRAEIDALNSKTSTFITADNYRSVLATFGTQTVTPVFVDTSLVSVIFGISGANGTGLCIRHNLNTYDFVFFDSRIRLVRYNSSTDTFSRKYYIDMIAMQ